MEERRFWKQKSFRIWIVIAVAIVLIVPIVILITLPEILWAAGVAEILTLLGLGFWLKSCLRQIGTIEVPSQAVLARFAKPVDAVPTGLFFALRPIEGFKEFPTGQSVMNYRITEGLYSKEDKKAGLSSQPMEVEISVYHRWPRVDRTYSFPRPEKEVEKELPPETSPDTTGLRKGLAWGRVTGEELLKRAYYRLPIKDLMKVGVDELGKFFEKGVIGASRHVMSLKDSIQCREQKLVIESEIKNYLLSEEGNPFFECAIPKECLDIEITKVKFPQDMEEAWIAPEISKKRAEAAVYEKKATKERLAGFIEQGVPEEIAALQVGGVEGKGMSFEQLRDLAIFRALGGFRMGGFRGSKAKKTREKH